MREAAAPLQPRRSRGEVIGFGGPSAIAGRRGWNWRYEISEVLYVSWWLGNVSCTETARRAVSTDADAAGRGHLSVREHRRGKAGAGKATEKKIV